MTDRNTELNATPKRWADQPSDATPEALEMGALFRAAEPPPIPSASTFATLRQELRSPPPSLWATGAFRRVIAAATISTILVVVAFLLHRPNPVPTVIPSEPPRRSAPVANPETSASLAPSASLEAPATREPAHPTAVAKPPHGGSANKSSSLAPTLEPAGPAVPEDGALAREAAALAPAFAALNQRSDPRGALVVLASYRTGFPRGTLARTADVLELRAWLSLGDDGPALARLNDFAAKDFLGVAGAPELRVLRAELLQRKGQFALAGSAFAQALAGHLDSELRERALFGRANALERQGNHAEGQAALAEYLKEFPQGRFAEEARKASSHPAP